MVQMQMCHPVEKAYLSLSGSVAMGAGLAQMLAVRWGGRF